MSDGADLATLLATGERAAFHGPPATAAVALEQAVVMAREQGRVAELAGAAWLLGVALGASGRYGAAVSVLEPLIPPPGADVSPERRLFAALAAATSGSVHRQLGRHAVGREYDLRALELSGGAGEAGFDNP